MFACEKFHEYVYGATVIGETDHKPLVSLHKKNLCDLTPRIQRMMLRLTRYDLKLEFKPGKYLIVADTLSRAFDRSVKKSNTEERSKHTWIWSDRMHKWVIQCGKRLPPTQRTTRNWKTSWMQCTSDGKVIMRNHWNHTTTSEVISLKSMGCWWKDRQLSYLKHYKVICWRRFTKDI